jgi:pyruvate formate lyase activating enzyme
MGSETSGWIFDLKRYALHDGPGIRTTVFLKGCPLRCWWCHNPESQRLLPEVIYRPAYCIRCEACAATCPAGAIRLDWPEVAVDRQTCRACLEGRRSDAQTCVATWGEPPACVEACYSGARSLVGRRVSAAEVLVEIERDTPFYDQSGGGVTFSGGEPLLQTDFLVALLQLCREHGLHTTLDTSGYASWRTFERILGLVDLYLYDLKLLDDTRHRHYTGVSNRRILGNLRALSARGERLVVRLPLVPEINDDAANLHQTGAFLAGLPHLERVEVMAYHKIGAGKYAALGEVYRLPETEPPTAAALQEALALLRSYGLTVELMSGE